MKVCIYNNKGGVGKTTLWFSADSWTGEESYTKGSVLVTSNPNGIKPGCLLVVDAPPDFDYIPKISDVDIWIIPVKGRFSLDGAMNVIQTLKTESRGHERIVFVSNMTDANDEIGRKQIDEAKNTGVELYKYTIARHLSFDKAEDMCCSVWSVPYSQRSYSVQALVLFSDWVLNGCPERSTYGQTETKVRGTNVNFGKLNKFEA